MASAYLDRQLRSEAQAAQDIADARVAENCDPAVVLQALLSALEERDIADARVDRLRTVARLSLDRHDAAREAERRAEAEIAARMVS